ncbi:C2H2-type domain-containing protein [Forsythia ovata]|uniref:C2H2-type domain-containing protein n=1 Tax=Forsythia ovata TaxID=205694 RepID=A0ABD1T307_9LAMI
MRWLKPDPTTLPSPRDAETRSGCTSYGSFTKHTWLLIDSSVKSQQRDQNLPLKLKQRANKRSSQEKVYMCPEKTCVHHYSARALGDLTGNNKHLIAHQQKPRLSLWLDRANSQLNPIDHLPMPISSCLRIQQDCLVCQCK